MAELFDIPFEQIATNPVGSPYNPFQVDPAAASRSFIEAMSNPELQNAILGAERTFRPQYTDINLSELQRYLLGTADQPGVLSTLGQVTPQLSRIQAGADTAAREAAISDITNLSQPTLTALMQANPEYFAQLNAAKQMGGPTDFFKDYEKALANRAILPDVRVNPADAALVENVPAVNLSGYTAERGAGPMLGEAPTATAAMLGAAPTVGFQGYGSGGYGTQGYSAVASNAPLLGAAPTMQTIMAGPAPVVQQGGYTAERATAPLLGAAPQVMSQGYNAQGYNAQGYDASRAAAVADVAAQNVTQGALGQSLYSQALQAAPTSASETFRQRAAQMATSTGQLSPEELRNAQQATREAFAARGLEMSNQAIAAEAMSRAGAVRERQAQDIQQASALNQAYLADLGASRGFATGVYGQDLGLQQANQAANLQAGMANQSVGAQISLANQAAINQARQFGAGATNEASRFTAGAQNEAAQFGAAAMNAAAMANAEQQARFALANQSTLSQTNLANVAAGTEASRFAAAAQNAAAMANAEQQARFMLANQQAGIQAGTLNAEQAARFSLANQATQSAANLANAAAATEAGRFGAMSANEAAQFAAAAANRASEFGAGAANEAARANADLMARYSMANQEATNAMNLANVNRAADFLVRNQTIGSEFNLANMAAANRANEFGADAANRASLANLDVASRNALANQDARNRMALAAQDLRANVDLANRNFAAARQDQGAADLARLGSLRLEELGANRANTINLANAYNAAFNPMRDVLGTRSNAADLATNVTNMGTGMMSNFMGPQVFSPDAGINLALANASNLANYRAAIEGANIAAAGAKSGAKTSAFGNIAAAAVPTVLTWL